jgi:EAL domain-containing protein (putative c-di-GMP-specific phosphodiesterase class I)/GGDEF domain-containing protein
MVVQQFNSAALNAADAIDDNERNLLIGLNVSAGARSRGSGAAAAALEHYNQALRLTTAADWQNAPQRLFDIAHAAAEAAYLATNFAELDRLVTELQQRSLGQIDAARVQELRIQGLLARNCLAEALVVGEATLAGLAVELAPLSDSHQWPTVPKLDELDLRGASDARVDTALRVLVWLTPCAYITSFEMYARVILTMIRLAREHPASVLTPISYSNYGLTLCGVGRSDEGFRAGELALSLSERVSDEPLRCKVWTLSYGFLQHWRRPAADSLRPLLKTVEDCLLCGDQEYLGYAAFLYCDKAWGLEKLAELERLHSRHTRTVEQFGHDFSWRHCLVWWQYIQALRGGTPALTLVGQVFDEQVDIARLEQANNRFSLFTAHTLKAMLACHRGDWPEVLRECRVAGEYMMTGGATLLAVDHRALWAIAELRHLTGQTVAATVDTLAVVTPMIEQLRCWAAAAPSNVTHKLTLVEAEFARASGNTLRAWELYEKAIEQAGATAFIRDRGFIAERAGDYYEGIGRNQLARERLYAAYEHYMTWGAVAVAEQLIDRYPWLAISEARGVGAAGGRQVAHNLRDKVANLFADLNVDRVVFCVDGIAKSLVADRAGDDGLNIFHLAADTARDDELPKTVARRVRQESKFIELTRRNGVDELDDPYFRARKTVSAAVMPIFRTGNVVGTVCVEAYGGRLLAEKVIGERLILHTQAIVDELRSEQLARKLEATSSTDVQTGLPNRLAFIKATDLALTRTRGARQDGTVVAVVRIRRFDDVVIIDGVDYGDTVLAEIARRLVANTPSAAAIARIDRLSFGLLYSSDNEQMALLRARHLLNVLQAPYRQDGELNIETDISVVFDDGNGDGTALLRDAETVLARMPGRGQVQVELFNLSQHRTDSDREVLTRDLRWALRNQGLRLAFQPIVDMRDNTLLGAEALVRWHHPVRGEIAPELLISVAEETGLIREVGRWVTEATIAQTKRWSVLPLAPNFSISFNASPRELIHNDYADFVVATLRRYDLSSALVVLEITESSSMEDESITQQNLQTLDNAGVKLCIDDFGVGTSSLSRLHAILARRLKIDRCFIEGLPDHNGRRSTVEMIIRLADAMDLDVVAEGVGQAAEVKFLRAAGLIKAQGFYYAKPLELPIMDAVIRFGRIELSMNLPRSVPSDSVPQFDLGDGWPERDQAKRDSAKSARALIQ